MDICHIHLHLDLLFLFTPCFTINEASDSDSEIRLHLRFIDGVSVHGGAIHDMECFVDHS